MPSTKNGLKAGDPWVSDTERAEFLREGVLVVPNVFEAFALRTIEAAFERLLELGHDLTESEDLAGSNFVIAHTGPQSEPAIQRVVWCGAAAPALAAMGEDPRILGRVLHLLGTARAEQLINQAHFKRPHDGVHFPFHQDAWNRRVGTDLWQDTSEDGAYVQCVLTVDDMTADNGPLLYVPGSHRQGLIAGDREAQLKSLIKETPARPLIAPAGALIFFGPFLVHGSLANQSTEARRILINGYARAGVNRRPYPGAGLGQVRELS